MTSMQLTILPLLLLTMLAAPAAASDDKTCPSAGVKITDEIRRFAVIVPKSSGLGHEQVYDDIGCAVLARNEECAMRQTMFDGAAVVRDHASGAEIPAEKAYFVLRTDVRTPRGSNIVAFGDRTAADKFSADHGKGRVVKWFELVDEKLK